MSKRRIGVWLIGALGSISTTVVVGALSLRKGLTGSTGMVTASDAFEGLPLVDPGSLEFGGCDIRRGGLRVSAHRLSKETGIIDREILESIDEDLEAVDRNISKGTARNCGDAIRKLASPPILFDRSFRSEIDEIRESLRRFRVDRALDEIVVVNLASTEPSLPLKACHRELASFETSLNRNEPDAASACALYAYASIREGCPYINFTPSNAALVPAMVQLAEEEGVPVMGSDGKTGETLVKSALAPLFPARNLEVLSWEGFNILGNMDGRVLDHPENKESKIRTKDRALSGILGYSPHSGVHIGYVPSLDDQKTAWDFIHFRGFLGVKMSLQFIWQGYDSILAAPLVLDLIRLAEFAKARGEKGLMPHLASYFKDPLGVGEYRLGEQHRMLMDYAREARTGGRTKGSRPV